MLKKISYGFGKWLFSNIAYTLFFLIIVSIAVFLIVRQFPNRFEDDFIFQTVLANLPNNSVITSSVTDDFHGLGNTSVAIIADSDPSLCGEPCFGQNWERNAEELTFPLLHIYDELSSSNLISRVLKVLGVRRAPAFKFRPYVIDSNQDNELSSDLDPNLVLQGGSLKSIDFDGDEDKELLITWVENYGLRDAGLVMMVLDWDPQRGYFMGTGIPASCSGSWRNSVVVKNGLNPGSDEQIETGYVSSVANFIKIDDLDLDGRVELLCASAIDGSNDVNDVIISECTICAHRWEIRIYSYYRDTGFVEDWLWNQGKAYVTSSKLNLYLSPGGKDVERLMDIVHGLWDSDF